MSNGVTTFVNNRLRGFAAALLLLAATCGAWAGPVKITFLPPPMEGNLSLGIYDNAGKLVRVLHQEIEPGELTKGDDGLETQWDGRDDQGKPCPPGTYRARGVLVGDLGVEGVGFIGNDWVDGDDSPRIRRIVGISLSKEGAPVLATKFREDADVQYYGVILKTAATPGEETEIQLALQPGLPEPPKTTRPPRTPPPQPGDPPAVKLAASPKGDKLYVLYENAKLQRLRGYDFTGVKPGKEPKALFEQDIRASDTYEQIASELKFPDGKPFVPSPTLTVALVPNPLAHNKPGSLQIKACINRAGCYLATADGLPLSHISDTRFLRWAVMGQPAGSNAITLFDSDGAVVEQFQIAAIAHMMAFDAGAVEWPGEATTPSPSPSPTPPATPAPTATPPASPTATPAAPAAR